MNQSNQSKRGGKPFLKWAGGKTQLLSELRQHAPQEFNKYIEPFVGGGALFFDLAPESAVIADSNEELILTYQIVQNEVTALIDELQRFKNEEKSYYEIRSLNTSRLSEVRRAARLIYLNKTCFNGLYRVNKRGQFNVPFGRRANPTICDSENLLAANRALQRVTIVCGDYLDVLARHSEPGDFVFLDPPYHPTGIYSDFKRYTKEFFYTNDHFRLRNEIDRLVELGCCVLITNSDSGIVRRLYVDLEFQVFDSKRLISSDPSTRTGKDLIAVAGF